MKRGPLKIFYSYTHEDEALRKKIGGQILNRKKLGVKS
jgi:hypothetical protein